MLIRIIVSLLTVACVLPGCTPKNENAPTATESKTAKTTQPAQPPTKADIQRAEEQKKPNATSPSTTVEKTPAQEEVPAKQVKMHPRLAEYRTLAKGLMAAIDSGEKAEAVNQKARALMDSGTAILPVFQERHPDCSAYLKALIAALPTMGKLSLDEIERDYHADGKLPKSPNEGCYHAKDLVVHPATVIILSQAGLKTKEARAKALQKSQKFWLIWGKSIKKLRTHSGQTKD